jgi:hypothetical protein
MKIIRRKESYDYKFNKNDPGSWGNNFKNNMKDTLQLFDDEKMVFECLCQSVSNSPTGRLEDTVAPGKFGLKLFIDRRAYYCDVHGIVDAMDIEGQYIDFDSVENNDKSRWLMHDTQKPKPALRDTLCSHAWSAGCFIVFPVHLSMINQIIKDKGLKPNDIITGVLEEV